MCVHERYRYFHQLRSHFGNITCSEFTMANGKCPFRWWHSRVVFLFASASKWNVKTNEWILICIIWYLEITSQESSITWFWCDCLAGMACVSISGNSFRLWFYHGNFVCKNNRSRLPYGLARRILSWIWIGWCRCQCQCWCRCPFNRSHSYHIAIRSNEFYVKASDDTILILINIRIYFVIRSVVSYKNVCPIQLVVIDW